MHRPPIRFVLAALALGIGCAHAGQQARPTLAADATSYDLATGDAVYTGHVRAVWGDIVFTADRLTYNASHGTIDGTGNFALERGPLRLLAQKGTYNLQARRLQVDDVRLGRFPVYVTGESAEGTLDEFTVHGATVFFREHASYTPSFTASRLTYSRGRIVSADDLALGLLGGRVLRLPHLSQSLDSGLLSHLTVRAGYRRNLGAFLQLGAHLPIGTFAEAGADAAYYTSRGLMIGPSGAYDAAGANSEVHGSLESGYINDHGEKLTDILARPVPEDRGFVSWRHRQRIGDRITIDGELNYWSDSEILRDFRPKEFQPVQQPDSFLEAAYAGDNSVFEAFVRVHPNSFQRMQERLPELRFDLLPSPVLPDVYQRLNASAARLEADSYLGEPKFRTTRLDAYYGLSAPLSPVPWFTLTPVAGGRVTHYTNALGPKDGYTRTLGEVGFDARLRASGTFDYTNPLWNINGLRHLIEPTLSYRYAPEASRGRPYIPPIDRRAFATYLPPLSIADSRNIDDLRRLDTLRIGLGNTLQTRDPAYGSRDLASLDFAADYWFTRSDNGAGRKGVGDIHTEAMLAPAPWLRFHAYHRYDPHNQVPDEFNTAIELTDQDWWSVRVGSHFLKNDYEEYSLEYRQRLNEVWEVVGRWRYDARRTRFNEQTYGVWQRLGQTWAIRYETSFFEGPRRESSFGFSVEVELLKF